MILMYCQRSGAYIIKACDKSAAARKHAGKIFYSGNEMEEL
jgi:hypothetical protein